MSTGGKACSDCGAEKPAEEFGKRGAKCRSCRQARRREYYATNRDQILQYQSWYYLANKERARSYRAAYKAANKDRARDRDLQRKYGITLDDFRAMLADQDGGCKICRRSDGPLHVDHCHTTGKVRGLLCIPCNRALGYMKDDPDLLRSAADYLDRSRV